MMKSARHISAFLAVVFAACGGSPADLLSVPPPAGLQEMSGAVGEQYRERRAGLEDTLADASATEATLADAYGELGLWFHAYQLSDGALAAYANARRLAPESSRWAYYLGALYSSLGRTDEARREMETFLRLQPGNVAVLVRLAELELAAGQVESAEVLLREAVGKAPDCARAMVGLATVLEGRGNHSAARDWLVGAAEIQPESQQIRYALALSHRRVGELDRAAALLAFSEPQARPDIRIADPLADTLRDLDVGLQGNMRRARRAAENGRHDVALRFFRRALEAEATSPEAWLGAARALEALGRLEAAVDELAEAVTRLPENPRIHIALAARLARSGRGGEARRHFRKALSLDPESRPARRGLGDLLVAEGDLQGAERLFAQLRSTGLTEELAVRHGLTLMRLGRYEEARRSLEEDLLRLEEPRELELVLARLLAAAPLPQARDGDRSLALARAAFDAKPGLDAAEVVVMALAEKGRFDAAVVAQQGLIGAVKRAGRSDLVPVLKERLAHFETRKAWRDPFPGSEALDTVFVDPGLLGD